MYELKAKSIKSISPIIIENARAGKADLYISGNYYQDGIPSEQSPKEIQTIKNQVIIEIYSKKIYNSSILNSLLGSVLGYKTPSGKKYILSIQQEMLPEDTFEKDLDGNWYEIHNWSKIDSYNNEEINTEFISTTGKLTQGATIYYKSDIQQKIECTNEQKEILNSIEIYKGYNYISAKSTNIVKPYISINYDVELTDELKNAFSTNIVRAYIIISKDGFEINQDNYLKDFKLEDLRFIPDNGFFGGTVARRLTINFNNVDNQFNIQDEDLKFYISVEYNNVEYFLDYGNFIVQKPDTENTTDNTSFEALDYMCKFNQSYVDKMTYPCKLVELAENVCEQAGVELGNRDFKNANFIVTDNQFVGGETLRTVLSAIALSAFSFARIGQDNKVYIDFIKKENSDISLNSDKYYNLSFASKEYGPINKIILRNSQVEGENVAIQDDESIEKNGLHELVISDNPFAYTQEKRLQLIEAGREMFGFHYMPINSMNSLGYAFLDSTSLIETEDMQGNKIYSYVLNHTLDYDGTLLDEIECPALTETETKYTYTPEVLQKLQKTEFMLNKQDQTITGLITKTDGLDTQMTKVEQRVDGITETISSVETKVETAENKAENAQNTANDAVSQITTTNEKLTQVEENVDGITQTVSSVETQVGKIEETANNANQKADSAVNQIEVTNENVTKIEQNVNGITDSVTAIETNLNENYSTTEQMNSAIEQKAGSITSSVTKTIDNIQVGGTNLIPNSAPFDTSDYYISDTSSIELTLQNEETAPYRKCLRIRTLKQLTSTSGIYIYMTKDTLEEGKEYCFSIWLKATANTIVTTGYNAGGSTSFNVTTSWQKFTHKFTATATSSSKVGFPIYLPVNTIEGRQVFAHSIKLEEGNKITAWSPAPEDDVKGFEFGTKIIQDWESVQIAWNQISEYIQFINAMLQIKDTNNNLLMALTKDGQKFYNLGTLFATIGSANYANDKNQKGLSFGMNTNGRFISWGKQSTEDGNYIAKLYYCAENSFGRTKEGIYFGVPAFLSDELNLQSGRITGSESVWYPAVFINDNIKDGFVRLSRYQCSFDVEDAIYVKGYQVQTNQSDGRLKHNIKNTEINALDKIKQIKHRQFIWNKDNKEEHIGYIAQELEKVDENYVIKNPQYDENGNVIDYLYQVNLLPILATATKAISELEEKLEEKESIINKQQEFLFKIAEKLNMQDEYNTTFNTTTPKMAKAMKIENDEVDYGTDIKYSKNSKATTPNRMIITKDGIVRKENNNE